MYIIIKNKMAMSDLTSKMYSYEGLKEIHNYLKIDGWDAIKTRIIFLKNYF